MGHQDTGKQGDEVFKFDLKKRVDLGGVDYRIVRHCERRDGQDKLLVSYYAEELKKTAKEDQAGEPTRNEKRKEESSREEEVSVVGFRFIKTSTFYLHRPTDYYLDGIERNHARFRQMKRLQHLFRGLEQAAPAIFDVGTFEVEDALGEEPDCGRYPYVELDYLVSELVGHVDLRTYFSGNESELNEQIDFVVKELKAREIVRAHFEDGEEEEEVDNRLSDAGRIKERLWRDPEAGAFPGLNPDTWYTFAASLTRQVKRLHNHGLIHGQLSVDSVRLNLQSSFVLLPTLIDFEESKRFSGRVLREGRSQKADETHDISGLGEIFFYLACGKEWKSVRSDEAARRGCPENELSLDKTDTQRLVTAAILTSQAPDSAEAFQEQVRFRGIAKIVDKCLRDKREDQHLCCEDIAEALDILNPIGSAAQASDGGTSTKPDHGTDDSPLSTFRRDLDCPLGSRKYEMDDLFLSSTRSDFGAPSVLETLTEMMNRRVAELAELVNVALRLATASEGELVEVRNALAGKKGGKRAINEAIRKLQPEIPTFAHAICHSRLHQLQSAVESLSRRHYEVHGDREELIDHLTRSLAGLQPGDLYLTLTRPSYWSQQNLGSNGRFLSMNHMLTVGRGVNFIRLFVVRKEEADLDDVRRVLESHASFEGYLRGGGSKYFATRKDDLENIPVPDGDAVPQQYGALILDRLVRAVAPTGETNRESRCNGRLPTLYYTGVSIVGEGQRDSTREENGVLNSVEGTTSREDFLTAKHVALILSFSTKTYVTISFHDHDTHVLPNEMEDFGEGEGQRRIHKVRFTVAPWDVTTGFSPGKELAQDFIRAMDFHLAKAIDVGDFLKGKRSEEPKKEGESEQHSTKLPFGAEEV